jgi:hypothetical protein
VLACRDGGHRCLSDGLPGHVLFSSCTCELSHDTPTQVGAPGYLLHALIQ